MWTWIGISILVVLVLILFLPLTTVINLNWQQDNRSVRVELVPGLKLFKLKKYWDYAGPTVQSKPDKLRYTATKTKEKTSSLNFGQLGWIWYWWNSEAASRRFKRVRLSDLVWETSFSTGDVALTGVAAGAVWAIKGWLLGLTSSLITLEKVKIEVWPTWDNYGLQTRFACIVNTRLVHIIAIGISAAWYYGRYQWLAK